VPGSNRVRSELSSNIVATYRVAYGDIEAAFRKAAHVFKEELWQHRGSAHPIEARGLVAQYEPAHDGVTVFASTQKAHDLYQNLSAFLAVDETRLRVATPDVGGGFGPKLCVYPEDVAVTAAAHLLKRSLKWIEDRREHFVSTVHERDQYWTIEIAVDEDGHVLGIRGKLHHDQGAYACRTSTCPTIPRQRQRPYLVPALAMESRGRAHQQSAGVVGARRGLSAGRLRHGAAVGPGCARTEDRTRRASAAQSHPAGKASLREADQIPRRAAIVYDSGDYPACQAELLKAAGLG